MKKYILGIGIAAIVVAVALAQAGIGVKSMGDGNYWNKERQEKLKERMHHEKMGYMKMARAKKMVRVMHKNLLNMDREEGTLYYSNGTFYVDNTPLYVGDTWWLNHTIRSDYDRDGNYETVWQELKGLAGSHVVVNGIYKNGTLIVSHINGIFLRMPVITTFVSIIGTLEKINNSYFIDGYHIIIPNKMARSDYDGDGMLERMHAELDGLVGSDVRIDGYVYHGNIRALHINGIEV